MEAQLLELAVQSAPCGIVAVAADERITLVNPWVEDHFGVPRDELISRPVSLLLPGFKLPGIREPGGPSDQNSGSERSVCIGHRGDGTEFTVEVTATQPAASSFLLTISEWSTHSAALASPTSAIESQVEFERIVAELSTQFINLPPERLDDTVRDALRRFGLTLGVDRCTFFRIQPDFTAVAPIGWQREGIPASPAPIAIKEGFPWVYETITSGSIVCFSSVDEIPSATDRDGYRSSGIRSSTTVPLSVAGRIVGGVGFNTIREERGWPPDIVHRLRVFALAFGNVLARRENDEALERALEETNRLKNQLQAENVYLRAEMRERHGPGGIIGSSDAIRRVLALVDQVAATDSTVLLRGETGTGKELLATRIHSLSRRSQHPMVRVNCAAIPSTLIESELFGREKGAFTGALARQIGRFEVANHSTIFLDEIGDVPPEVQVKLLRVLEERQIERLGSPRAIRIDTRIVAATHRNLEQRMADGTFREDLFYRLSVFPIDIPPLRERVDDIPLLVWRFVEEFARAFGKPIEAIPRDNMIALERYPWPGNIRELRNVVERAMILARGPRLVIAPPRPDEPTRKGSERLSEFEREHVLRVLQDAHWRIRGAGGAAERLGLRPTTLETRITRLGLKRPARAG